MTVRTIYPDFDVMAESAHWDENTRHLVESRLKRPGMPKFFSPIEFNLLKAAMGRLVDETDDEILGRVAGHIDEHLANEWGQGFHKVGVPAENQLFRDGLDWLEATGVQLYQRSFLQLNPWEMDDVLGKIQRGEVMWTNIPPREFFQKLLFTTVDFFFSQPDIWSEIGYGGPAYPRGYYRIEYGLKDPWEPRLDPELVKERAEAGLGPGPIRRVDR